MWTTAASNLNSRESTMTKQSPKSQQNPRPSSLKKSAAMHTYSETFTIAPASPESDQETVLKKYDSI